MARRLTMPKPRILRLYPGTWVFLVPVQTEEAIDIPPVIYGWLPMIRDTFEECVKEIDYYYDDYTLL